jgi:hypothetical protein
MEIAFAMPDPIGRIERRMLGELAQQAEEWSRCQTVLSRWEDDHLLDNPTPERLAEHKQAIEHLLRLGRILSQATGHPDYPDQRTAEMVQATQSILEDVKNQWHRPRTMSKEQADQVLAEVFPEES